MNAPRDRTGQAVGGRGADARQSGRPRQPQLRQTRFGQGAAMREGEDGVAVKRRVDRPNSAGHAVARHHRHAFALCRDQGDGGGDHRQGGVSAGRGAGRAHTAQVWRGIVVLIET